MGDPPGAPAHAQAPQQRQRVAALRAAGGAAFAAGRAAEAERAWSEALAAARAAGDEDQVAVLSNNRAAARLRLTDWAGAWTDAAAASASPAAAAASATWRCKALFRQAAALRELGRPVEALRCAEQALHLEPGDRAVAALAAALAAAAAAAAAPAPALSVAVLPPALRAASEFAPSPDGVNANLLVLFHGLGDRPAAFARLARRLALPQTAVLALGAPLEVPLSDGGRSWYDVFDASFELIRPVRGEARRLASLERTLALLEDLLGSLGALCGFPARSVHLFGFSQGATVALTLAARVPGLGSCLAVAGSLLPEWLWAGDGGGGGASLPPPHAPVLITHGNADTMLMRRTVEETAAWLRSRRGMAVQVVGVPGKGHAMLGEDEGEARAAMEFWAGRLLCRPAVGDGLVEVLPGVLQRVAP